MKNKPKETKQFQSRYPFMPLNQILEFENMMREKEVSKVSRKTGFLFRLKRVKGRYDKLGYKNARTYQKWLSTRENFIKRHMAQVQKRGEPLIIDGLPSRRLLSFYAWGFDPVPKETRKMRIKLKRR